MTVTLRDAMGCSCLRIRRATRRLTQIYDSALEPVGLTVNQFGLLASLHDPQTGRPEGLSMNALSQRLGTDPSTLNRSLKPLQARSLIRDGSDSTDARVRIIQITSEGEEALTAALPLWGLAQRRIENALGASATEALNTLLDTSIARLASEG